MTIEEEQAAEIERLEQERNALREENARLNEKTDDGEADDCKSFGCLFESWKTHYQKLKIQNTALREENERLRDALQPFVDRLEVLEETIAHKYAIGTNIDVEHLRAARAALQDGEKDG